MPLRNERIYRITAAIAGGLYGVLSLIVAVRLISTSGFAPEIVTEREILMLYVFPSLLGGLAGIFISRHVIDAYLPAKSAAASSNLPPDSMSAPKPA
jgi:hypothetical protein